MQPVRAALIALALALLSACTAEPAAKPEPVCAPLSIRACETDACAKGAQQCGVEGLGWTSCNCTILDASFEAQADAVTTSDAPDDASDAGDAASDAAGVGDASGDAALDSEAGVD